MGDYNNIEDFFKDKFGGAKATPSGNLWDNIEKSLESEVFFEKKFQNFKVQPNSRIWLNIQKRLSYLDFMRFGLARFNIYYLLLLLFSFSTIFFITSNRTPSRAGMSVNSNFNPLENVRLITYSKNYIAESNEQKINNSTGNSSDQKNDVVSDLLNKVFNDETGNEFVPKSKHNKNSNNQTLSNPTAQNSTNTIKEDTETNLNNKSTITSEVLENYSSYNKSSINPRYNFNLLVYSENNIDYIDHQAFSIESNPIDLLNEHPNTSDFANTVHYNHSYIKYRSPELLQNPDYELELAHIDRNDTLGVDAYGDDIIIPRSKHSIDLFYSPAYTSAIFDVSNPEMPYFLNEFKESHKPLMSDNYGIHYNYEYKKFRIQTGLQYSQYNQEFTYNEEYISVDTSYLTNEILYEYTVNDTVWFIDMNHFNQTGQLDSIFKIIPTPADSVHIINIAQYDTISNIETSKSINRYKYIELPLIVGYRFGNSRLSFTPKVGIIAGLLISSSGRTYNYADNNQIVDLNSNNQPYIKPNISYIASLEIGYEINNSFSVIIDPYYRKNINSIFQKSYPVNQQFSAYGVKMGIRYNF